MKNCHYLHSQSLLHTDNHNKTTDDKQYSHQNKNSNDNCNAIIY